MTMSCEYRSAPALREPKLTDVGHSCMRRLQANLGYLAALADRKAAQTPPSPSYLTAPSLNLNLRLRFPLRPTDNPADKPIDPNPDRPDRDKCLKDLYKKLQALFPGIDPRKETLPQAPNSRPGAPNQHPNQGTAKGQNGQVLGGHGSNHSSPAPGPQAQRTPQMMNAAAPMMQMQSAVS